MKKKLELPEKFCSDVRMLLQKERVPQSVLLTGGTAELRRNAAVYLAAALECEQTDAPCLACRACRKVRDGVHPDVYLTESGGKSDSVRMEDVRRIRQTVDVLPNEGSCKVYVIPRADRLRPEAQNALLKLLEEPPRFAAFILCSEGRAALEDVLEPAFAEKLSRIFVVACGSSYHVGVIAKWKALLVSCGYTTIAGKHSPSGSRLNEVYVGVGFTIHKNKKR